MNWATMTYFSPIKSMLDFAQQFRS